jgi:hypothetical protein
MYSLLEIMLLCFKKELFHISFQNPQRLAAMVLLILERKKISTVLEVRNELCPSEITFLLKLLKEICVASKDLLF